MGVKGGSRCTAGDGPACQHNYEHRSSLDDVVCPPWLLKQPRLAQEKSGRPSTHGSRKRVDAVEGALSHAPRGRTVELIVLRNDGEAFWRHMPPNRHVPGRCNPEVRHVSRVRE